MHAIAIREAAEEYRSSRIDAAFFAGLHNPSTWPFPPKRIGCLMLFGGGWCLETDKSQLGCRHRRGARVEMLVLLLMRDKVRTQWKRPIRKIRIISIGS